MQIERRRPRLEALTGLRFVAAAHVVFYHFGSLVLTTAPIWFSNLLAGGESAVSLFFILSGFVLAYNYADRGPVRRCEFWVARFARIYPAYALAFLVTAPFAAPSLGLRGSLVASIPTVTLLQAWFWQTATKWNFPAWSLSAEAFYYALFPLLLPVIRPGKRLYAAIVGLWAVCLSAAVLYGVLDLDQLRGGPRLWDGPWLSTIAYNPLMHLPEFLVGMLLARVFLTRPTWARSAVAGTAAAVGTIVVFLVSGAIPIPILHNGLLTPLFAVLVYALASGNGPLAWVLSRKPVVLLGEASYSLYILQYPVWHWTNAVAGQDDAGSLAILLPYFVILVVCSLLSLIVVERPARRALRRWLPADHALSAPQLATT